MLCTAILKELNLILCLVCSLIDFFSLSFVKNMNLKELILSAIDGAYYFASWN